MARPIVRKIVRRGSKGTAVKKLQRALNKRFSNKVSVDEQFGPTTAKRVRRFQRTKGLTPDGVVGRSTWRQLGYTLKLPKGKVIMAPGAKPAGKLLMGKLKQVSADTRIAIKVISGDRSAYQAWILRMRYKRGTGNLAARCCWRYDIHSWSACGKSPRSNHARGKAVDAGTYINGNYSSLGYNPKIRAAMRRRGLCLPVPNEPWHLESGNTWRA